MRIYLDHQAATPLLPEAREAMNPFLASQFGNPSSLHQEGFAAREAVARAREHCARLLNAEAPENIIFTGSGTEAVNLAIKGAALANQRAGRHIILSAAEQPATTKSCAWLAELGFEITTVPVDHLGRISPENIAAALRPETILVCLHHSNQDAGTLQPIAEVGRITSERGIPFFVDAIGSAGWIPVDVQELRADLLAISPHRFYGPKGIGVLYRHRRARLIPHIHGGEQEEGRRAGTENVAGIVGAGVAAEMALKDLSARAAHVRNLQERALAGLMRTVSSLKLNGPEPGPDRHPANLNLSVEFAEGEALGLMLDVKGIAIASGPACTSARERIPPVLAAMGLPEELAKGTVVISFGKDNTESEVDHLVETFARAAATLREMSPDWEDFQRGKIQSRIKPGHAAALKQNDKRGSS